MLGLAGLVTGCGGSVVTEPTALRGPHLGTTLQLPDKTGYVELVNEPEVKDRRSNEPTALVAYFLKNDARSPLDPPPTDVRFAIDSGGGRESRAKTGSPQVIPLGAEPKSGDPAGAGRFVSKPGPYQLESLRGTLDANIGGQKVSVILPGGR
jgi:hypothetical protein